VKKAETIFSAKSQPSVKEERHGPDGGIIELRTVFDFERAKTRIFAAIDKWMAGPNDVDWLCICKIKMITRVRMYARAPGGCSFEETSSSSLAHRRHPHKVERSKRNYKAKVVLELY
jgi:hypothetical protein